MKTPLESSVNNHLKPKEEEKEEEDSLSLAMEMLGLNVVPLAMNSTVEIGVFDTIAKAHEGAMLSAKKIASQIRSNNPEAPHGNMPASFSLLASLANKFVITLLEKESLNYEHIDPDLYKH
ncbi:hypothetical protein AHAS_Ahas09G0153200 [Arachis hypogaea]